MDGVTPSIVVPRDIVWFVGAEVLTGWGARRSPCDAVSLDGWLGGWPRAVECGPSRLAAQRPELADSRRSVCTMLIQQCGLSNVYLLLSEYTVGRLILALRQSDPVPT